MSGFSNPIIGGGGGLVYPSIHSPNFNVANPAASPSPSWGILKSGQAYFSGLTVTGGTDLYYSPSAALGNLVMSVAAAAGTDAYGNAYLAGIVGYANVSGTWYAAQTGPTGTPGSAAVLSFYTAPGPGGPWTMSGNVTSNTSGAVILAGTQTGTPGTGSVWAQTPLLVGATPAWIMLPPSGDTSGATDGGYINYWLGLGVAVQLLPGIYYVNVPVEVPAGGVLAGAGRDGVDQFSGQTIIRATAAKAAVVCSTGWLEGTNTATLNSITLRNFKVDGNNLATHGIVVQNIDSLIENCQSGNVSGDAFRLDGVSQNGAVSITGSGVNCRFVNCLAEDCGRGFATNDPHGIFTDGFIVNCHAATISGVAAIDLTTLTGWLITGNHLYGLTQNGIRGAQMFMTRITGNYVETWGGSGTAGTYAAILDTGSSDEGSGSVISGNTLDCHAAPGNAGSTIVGIKVVCQNNNTATWAIAGNLMRCSPTTGFAAAYGIQFANLGAGSILIATSTGNNPTGHWTASTNQIPNGGTITVTAGV